MLIAKADLQYALDIFRRASQKSEPVVFSSDTIYGIGAPVSDTSANEKIFDIKGRDRSKPFPILIADTEQLENIACVETDRQREVMQTVWPGPVTLIMKAKPELSSLYTINGTVALRMPAKKWLRELIKQIGPISATSANPAGTEYRNCEKELLRIFSTKVTFFLFDNNITSTSSDIIDISSDNIKVLRGSDELLKQI